ncbi:hypothetical protein MNBD_GAMMA16-536 [hydrothermal vent metagenome]|uniref:Polysaccharide chain length determinant N-terminal domain-containing protein n=1 Tax=hydrothermal vent metagenome TaxID=652676 RepID=A0A3B0YYW5_9ZZZZ
MVRDSKLHPTKKEIETAFTYPAEDEISLIDLWRLLANRKWIIVGFTVVITLVAMAYALLQPRTYQAEAFFLPPNSVDISSLNLTHQAKFTTSGIYNNFLTALSSRTMLRQVFDEQDFAARLSGEQVDINENLLFQSFVKSVNLTIPETKENSAVTQSASLVIEGQDPELITHFVNTIVEHASDQVIDNAQRLLRKNIETRLAELQKELAQLRKLGAQERKDEILRMEAGDDIDRKEVLDAIQMLRTVKETERLNKIIFLEEQDAIEIETILDEIATLRANAKAKRNAEIVRLEEADSINRSRISNTIIVLRIISEKRRIDRINELTEAANIAAELGIKKRSSINFQSDLSSNQPTFYAGFATQQGPTYLMGEDALRSEIRHLESRKSNDAFIADLRSLQKSLKQLEVNEKIDELRKRENDDPFIAELAVLQDRLGVLKKNETVTALKARKNNDPFIIELPVLQSQLQMLATNRLLEGLKSRKNDDPFISSLRSLEQEKSELESITINTDQVRVLTLDQAAFLPLTPIKPNRKMITLLGVALGLMLGIFAAFFMAFLQRVHQENEAT